MKTQRIAELEKASAMRGKSKPETHFAVDYHEASLT